MNLFEIVKYGVSCREAAERYGVEVNHYGMALCPFHNDRHPSLYVADDHYHCFACGEHGDVIDFAAKLFGLPLYEAAQIDGASHWQQTRYISIPHLVPIFCLMLILGSPGLIGGSFDLFYLIPRDVQTLYPVTDILPTYLFRALKEGSYAKGAAVGFLQSICSTILILSSNFVVRKVSPENSLF